MMEWLVSIVPEGYANAILWLAAALALLIIVLFLIRIIRRFATGTFVAGGRNRRARLAVMDAAAIDSRRRLVLVRRDDVEHLILIGGPTDVVVEQDIRLVGRPARPLAAPESQDEGNHASDLHLEREQDVPVAQPPVALPEIERPARPPFASVFPAAVRPAAPAMRPVPPPQPLPQRPATPEPTPRAMPEPPVRPAAQAPSPPPQVPPRPLAGTQAASSRPEPSRPEPSRPETARPEPGAAVAPTPSVSAASRQEIPEIDVELLNELEASLDGDTSPDHRTAEEPSLEDEMSKLLGELSGERR